MEGDAAPLVSVITPCLNAADWLPGCIASVKAQGIDHLEHIVMDGGSTDGTVELLRSEPQIRWRSEPDKGQSDAINKGLRAARGRLVTWLNADDVLEPGAVTAVLDAWHRDPSAAIFYGDCAVVENGNRSVWTPPPAIRLRDFENRFPLPQVGTFVTADALRAVDGVRDDLNLAMDFDLFLRLSLAGHRFVYTGATLASFVVHPTSKSGANVHGEFLQEEARALRAAGLEQAAEVATGRASAQAHTGDDGRWTPGFWTTTRAISPAARAGAHLEASRMLMQAGSPVRAVPHLLHPSVWRCRITRDALTATARRLPQRVTHRRKVGA